MKIVIAIDSFKGSVTSMEAGHAAAEGRIDAILSISPGTCSLEEAMDKENTRRNISFTCEQIGRLVNL